MPELQVRWKEATQTFDGDLRIMNDWIPWADILEYETLVMLYPAKMQIRIKPEECNEREDSHSSSN